MFIYGDQLGQQCPVVGAFEETGWNTQCPMYGEWSRQPERDSRNGVYNTMNSGLSVQCYKNYYPSDVPKFVPHVQQVPYSYVSPTQFQENLPCAQNQNWDYNSMCFNVDGQSCQFTNVVDLEDFMNNEKRKEKSRVAARCRRTKEVQIFAELTAALPAKKEEVEQLDKASIMRLAISYLRVRDVVSMLPEDSEPPKLQSPKGLEEIQSELSYMNALDGFVLVLSQQGDIVYCSENIAEHLGVSQMEIMGQSVYEFSHPCDHDEVREALRSADGRRELLLRMKCTLTSKGRNVHLKSASYKVIHVVGHMLTPKDKKTEKNNNDDEDKKDPKTGSLVAVGRPIPHPSNIEIPLDSKTFLSKHSLDMKFTYTDEGLMNTLGFEPDELVGHSLYEYHHAADSASLIHQFKSLFSKGQCETGQYRFLAKTGGYAWVQTQATVITDKQQKPVSVVCVNYVISGIECKDEVFAAHQVQHADLKPAVELTPTVPALPPICESDEPPNGAIVAHIIPEEERPIPVTELIFAPKEKEMNKGFLMFSPGAGVTMLKDEPDDLTHLAPTAGDACIPLENCPFEMFDEFILNDNYCSLLSDDLENGSPVDSLIADSLLSSPEPQETESSCEQSSLLTELSLDTFDGARSDNDIDDGTSPFIPTTDELPLLEPAVMWGALPENVRQARPQPSEPPSSAPALQRLLAAPPTGPPPQDIITNIYSDQGLIPSRSVSSWDQGVKRVMSEDEDNNAKRAKRSPSPPPKPQKSSSSVLMNLLDLEQQRRQAVQNKFYPLVPDPQKTPPTPQSRDIPLPVINLLQAEPIKQMTRANKSIATVPNIRANLTNAISPLSINIGPMYLSPTYSDVSPRKDLISPYSTPQSLSPNSYMYSPNRLMSPAEALQDYDPYLNKFQPSPGFEADLMESNIPIASDFWTDTEILQNTSDLMSAFDDVKLG